jgi:hypothetical protein
MPISTPSAFYVHYSAPDFLSGFEERFRLVEARVVDHHLDQTELVHTRRNGGADRCPVGHVDALENRPALI